MTERLADISARIDGIRQLGAVVNAMKGIAAARAHVARDQVHAVDSFAATIAAAMSRIISQDAASEATSQAASQAASRTARGRGDAKPGVLAFGAEQGFAGAFSERVLDSIAAPIEPACLFVIGTRAASVAISRGLDPFWTAAMPSRTLGIPKLADQVTTAIYGAVADGRIDRLDVVFTGWSSGRPVIVRRRLFPIDLADLPSASPDRPLTQIPDGALMDALGEDWFNALVCRAALHAFAAENEARMEAMSAAGAQIARELETFQARLRIVRQEAITAEIIELGAGAASARGKG